YLLQGAIFIINTLQSKYGGCYLRNLLLYIPFAKFWLEPSIVPTPEYRFWIFMMTAKTLFKVCCKVYFFSCFYSFKRYIFNKNMGCCYSNSTRVFGKIRCKQQGYRTAVAMAINYYLLIGKANCLKKHW